MLKWHHVTLLTFACLFLYATFSVDAKENASTSDSSVLEESYKSMAKDDSSSTLFKLDKASKSNLLRLRTTATDRKYTGNDTGSFGLEAFYGHLFLPVTDQYNGYYLISGKVESDYRQRFNATAGYFLPGIGGEARLTYRLLNTEIRQTLPQVDEFKEYALEQAIGLMYRKRFTTIFKELSFKYAYTNLGEEKSEHGPYILDSDAGQRIVTYTSGFGEINSHDAHIEISAGSESIKLPILEGLRLDLGGGYQSVKYGEFLDVMEFTDDGLSGYAQLKMRTPIGILKGFYQDGQTARTAYGGYQLGGLDFYYKNIDYKHGEDEEIFGIALTLDLFNLGSIFDLRGDPFFYDSDTGFTDVNQMKHMNFLAPDDLIVKPRVYEQSSYVPSAQGITAEQDNPDQTDPRRTEPTPTDPGTPDPGTPDPGTPDPGTSDQPRLWDPCTYDKPDGALCAQDCECISGTCSNNTCVDMGGTL